MSKKYLGYLYPGANQITKQYTTPCPSHNHRVWELVFFFEGLATTTVDEKTYDTSVGDVFLLGPPHLHSITTLRESQLHQDVYYTDEELKKSLESLPEQFKEEIVSGKRVVHLKLSGENFEAVHSFCENLLRFSVFDSPLGDSSTHEFQKYLSLSLLQWIISLYAIRYSNRHPQIPSWLLDFLNQLQKPEVFSQRVSQIVALTNYSHSQVGTIFKSYKGVSLVDYLINLRMNYARELLEATDKSILQISEECGYNSLSTFIKTFREKLGCSPKQYRKKQKQDLERGFLLPKEG